MSSFVPAYTREMGELQGEQTTHLHCRNPLNTFCIRPPSERSFSKSFSITSAIHGISAASAVVIHAISEHNVQLNTACSVWFFFCIHHTLFVWIRWHSRALCLAKIWRRTVKGNRLHIYNGLNPSLLTFYVLALVVRALSCVFFFERETFERLQSSGSKILRSEYRNIKSNPRPHTPFSWALLIVTHCSCSPLKSPHCPGWGGICIDWHIVYDSPQGEFHELVRA